MVSWMSEVRRILTEINKKEHAVAENRLSGGAEI